MSPGVHEAVDGLAEVFRSLGESEKEANLFLLAERLREPRAFVAVVGETSSGKSTLINSLFGRALLPAGVGPTTSTVVHVSCSAGKTRFAALHRNGTRENLDQDAFRERTELVDDRLRRLEVVAEPPNTQLLGLQIFDTPGFNSVVEAHDEIMGRFLPECDAVVLVAGYRTGFGQADQDLVQLLRNCIPPDAPVVLVINRAPTIEAEDRRVAEIVRNAADTLRRDPIVRLVGSAPAPELPETGALWEEVVHMVAASARVEVVKRRLNQALLQLFDYVEGVIDRRIGVLKLGLADEQTRTANIAALIEARDRSLEAVVRLGERLRSRSAGLIRRLASETEASAGREVDASGKWLGAEDCVSWLENHILPFEQRRAGERIEAFIDDELQVLDREIDGIGNTAVARIERSVDLRSAAAAELSLKLGQTLTRRLAGDATHAFLRRIGGVGGQAAGAGNLVKMLVKGAGGVFGKRFGREVYAGIGRAFNKQNVGRAHVVLQFAVEISKFVYDAKTWQTKLKGRLHQAMQAWENKVSALLDEVFFDILEANVDGIHAIYDDLIREQGNRICEDARPAEISRLDRMRSDLRRVRLEFESERKDVA